MFSQISMCVIDQKAFLYDVNYEISSRCSYIAFGSQMKGLSKTETFRCVWHFRFPGIRARWSESTTAYNVTPPPPNSFQYTTKTMFCLWLVIALLEYNQMFLLFSDFGPPPKK